MVLILNIHVGVGRQVVCICHNFGIHLCCLMQQEFVLVLCYSVSLFENNTVYLLIDSINGYLGYFQFLYLWKYVPVTFLYMFFDAYRTHKCWFACFCLGKDSNCQWRLFSCALVNIPGSPEFPLAQHPPRFSSSLHSRDCQSLVQYIWTDHYGPCPVRGADNTAVNKILQAL